MFSRKLEILAPTPKEAMQLTTVAWFIVTAITTPAFVITGQVVGAEWFTVFWGAIGAWLLTAPIYFAVRGSADKPLWLVVPGALAALVAVSLAQMAADFGGQYLAHLWAATRMPDTSPQSIFLVTVIYFLIDACIVALFLITGTMSRIRMRERELAEAQVRRLETELDMLRLQLNPHFLCNSLNVVSSLILTGRATEANRMAEGLADFLTATMAGAAQISLREELDTVECYLELETARFGDRLTVSIDTGNVDDALMVPSFLLQPLVENAIKHGVEAHSGPSVVRISARVEGDALLLSVENRGDAPAAGRAPVRPGHGIGLANTRARLALLFGDEGALESGAIENGYRATVRLPARQAEGRMRDAA
jgi:two-component sensor histidine kinase